MAGGEKAKLDALDADVRARFETEQVPWLARLVDAPSCTREPEDVEVAARLVDDRAELLGLARRLVPDPERAYADHRIYETAAASGTSGALALVGHVDTVFPRAAGFLGFERDGDVIRGPGVLDMKSGLSVALFALQAVRAVAPDAWRSLAVRFVCNTDEEVGSPSSRPLFDELAPHTTGALVFEAGRAEDRIVTRRKGGAVYRVRVEGRAAHAGNEHAAGVSAIHALALLVPRIEALTDYERGVTANVGLIEGGTSKNTVPPSAVAVVDARFERPEDGAALGADIVRLADAPLPKRLADAEIRIQGGITRPPMVATDASRSLRAAYETHASALGLGVGEAPLQGGGSDANLLSAAGVPCIDGLGPWGTGFHTKDEWSSLASLLRRTQALARFLLSRTG